MCFISFVTLFRKTCEFIGGSSPFCVTTQPSPGIKSRSKGDIRNFDLSRDFSRLRDQSVM